MHERFSGDYRCCQSEMDMSLQVIFFPFNRFKDYVSKEYKQFNSQIIDLDKKLKVNNEEFHFSGNELRRRQYLSGYSIEDLELILHPMVEEGKEATGSMGDDTPVAVLSSQVKYMTWTTPQCF